MRRPPWVLLAAAAAMSITGVVLSAPAEARQNADESFGLTVAFVTVLLVFGLVGAVVAARLPANPIGWLFLVLALLEGVYELAAGYARHALFVDPGSLPGATWAAWVSHWLSPLSPLLLVAALLLFPDGRPPTPRWRWVLWACGPLLVLILLEYAVAPGPLDGFPTLSNPAALEGAEWLAELDSGPFVGALFLAAAVALVVRFRRSHGVERQQVKWFAFAAGVLVAFLIVVGAALRIVGEDSGDDSIVGGFVFAAVISGVPISTGIAILRHRLYDIDVVINRTLVYGSLTATLGATYLGLVLLIGLAVGESSFAVAVSTLAVAGLFRPARVRIQAVVDHRFYRRRYDAARTLEAFGARLRDELDLETLGEDVRDVVRDTVQPAHVSLWLREGSR